MPDPIVAGTEKYRRRLPRLLKHEHSAGSTVSLDIPRFLDPIERALCLLEAGTRLGDRAQRDAARAMLSAFGRHELSV